MTCQATPENDLACTCDAKECEECSGSGEGECWTCDGIGRITCEDGVIVDCEDCNGRGIAPCDACDGTGHELPEPDETNA